MSSTERDTSESCHTPLSPKPIPTDSALASLREIYEIYAGMEGFIPETAPGGYQQRIIKQMAEVALSAIASHNSQGKGE